jgi:hypothetical protein
MDSAWLSVIQVSRRPHLDPVKIGFWQVPARAGTHDSHAGTCRHTRLMRAGEFSGARASLPVVSATKTLTPAYKRFCYKTNS